MIQSIVTYSPLLYFIQSYWRDEAFSVLTAERSISFLISKLSFEPPVYYILLHFWIRLFGEGELTVRFLSLLGFSLATVVVINLAEKLFRRHWLTWFLPVFFFLNPMLLYYAFEVRTYAWNIFFTVLSMSAYLKKRWKLYILATTLGFYNHTYLIFIPMVQAIHHIAVTYIMPRRWSPAQIKKDPMIRSVLAVGLLILPWIVRVIQLSSKLKDSWYFPVNFQLVQSVLGNMFLGYEGTPWYGWQFTRWFSLLLLLLFIPALRDRINRKRNLLFAFLIFIPLALVIGASFIKPVFVNRYLIFVTVGEVFLLSASLSAIRPSLVQKSLAALLLTFVITFNMWYPSQHSKFDIRSVVRQANAVARKSDIILVDSPLIFFETLYYSSRRSDVYLYNPSGSPFPWYVGDAIVSKSQMARDFPTYPKRAVFIHQDGSIEIVYHAPLPSSPQKAAQ